MQGWFGFSWMFLGHFALSPGLLESAVLSWALCTSSRVSPISESRKIVRGRWEGETLSEERERHAGGGENPSERGGFQEVSCRVVFGHGFYSQFCLFVSPGTVTFGVTEQGLRDLQKQGWDWGP